MFDSIREWLSKWWTYLLLGVGVLVLLFRGKRTFQPQPPTVDTTKVTEATKVELDEEESRTKARELELAAERDAEIAAGLANIEEDAPDLLSDGDKLNEYLKRTGREVRK